MVHREVAVHLLGYNLIRKVMAEAAQQKGQCPRQLSFAGAFQTMEAFRWLLFFGSATRQQEIWSVVLIAVGTHKVGDRPGRCEPRKVKRRPKSHPLLMKPRAEERAQLLEEAEA